jgi:hypothetical protein
MRRNRFRSKSQAFIATCLATILGSLGPVILGRIVTALAAEQQIGAPPEAMNMRLAGYNDLQWRSAYQPTVHHQGNRYIAYIGHHGGTPEVPKPLNTLTGQPESNGTSIVDVTDPAHPQYLAHIPGRPGNYEEGGAQMTRVCDGSTLPKGAPNKKVGRLVMTPFNGAHTTFPMPKMPINEFAKDTVGAERDIVVIIDEQIRNACEEPRQMAWFVDVTIEAHPMVISNFQVPEASGDFCSRGGRFGTHASNESMAPIFYKKIVFLSYFNAGVRAVDPYHPKEIGYFIPAITAATDKRYVKVNGQDSCNVAIQTNNVETDDRGYIYIVDRANTGMHILELTGEAGAIATH